jgi:isopropylmalate/homocitrate/citramalate synthase
MSSRQGFPIASEGDFAAVKAVSAECRDVTVAALCRTAEQDVARAAERYQERRAHEFTPSLQPQTFISNTN